MASRQLAKVGREDDLMNVLRDNRNGEDEFVRRPPEQQQHILDLNIAISSAPPVSTPQDLCGEGIGQHNEYVIAPPT